MQDANEVAEMNRRSMIRQRMDRYRERLTFSQKLMSTLTSILAAGGSYLTYTCATTGNLGCAVLIGTGTAFVTLSSVLSLLNRSSEGREVLQDMERELNQPVEQFVQQNPMAVLRVRARRGVGSSITGSIAVMTPEGMKLGVPEEAKEMSEDESTRLKDWQSGAAKILESAREREAL